MLASWCCWLCLQSACDILWAIASVYDWMLLISLFFYFCGIVILVIHKGYFWLNYLAVQKPATLSFFLNQIKGHTLLIWIVVNNGIRLDNLGRLCGVNNGNVSFRCCPSLMYQLKRDLELQSNGSPLRVGPWFCYLRLPFCNTFLQSFIAITWPVFWDLP